jgi:hypothetical protein
MIVCALLLVGFNFATQQGGTTRFGPDLGGDYPAFYVAGHILNTQPDRLYDLALQEKLYREVIPDASPKEFLLFPSAPFFAVLYRPLALLPYAWSYLVWLVIGAGLAVAGVVLLRKATPELSDEDGRTAMLASLSFAPLLLEGWVGGQTTALVLFCVALGVYLRQEKRPVSAGIVLAMLAFKPTLLLLMVPMLAVTRSFRVLLGMAIGGLGLLCISIWAVGIEGCRQFVILLGKYAEVKSHAPELLKPSKYIDLRSSVYPVFYHPQWWASILLVLLVLAGAALLLWTWRRSTDERLAWSSALVWTPVLSPHLAIYDAALLIPGVFLAAASQRSSNRFLTLVTLVYVLAWCSQAISAIAGFQPLTFAIALLGVYVCRANGERPTR